MRPSTMLVLRSVTICATSAFQMRLSLGDAKRPYLRRGCRCQTCPIEFILLAWEVTGGEVHPLHEMHRDDVGDELGHFAEVSQAILNASRAEGDVGRVAPHQVEVGVGCDVAHSALRNRRNPTNRPWHHQGSQELIKAGRWPVGGAEFESAIERGGRGVVKAVHETGLILG